MTRAAAVPSSLPLFADLVSADEKARTLSALPRLPYTFRVIRRDDWGDGGKGGWGATISTDDGRRLGDFRTAQILDAMYADYVQHGGKP